MNRRHFLAAGAAGASPLRASPPSNPPPTPRTSPIRSPNASGSSAAAGTASAICSGSFRSRRSRSCRCATSIARMLDEAADMVATRQRVAQRPRTYGDYREMLAAARSRHRPRRHAGSLARPADDRGRRGGGRRLRAEADQRRRRRRAGDGRGGAAAQQGRAGRHAAAQHAAHRRGHGPRHQGRTCSGQSPTSRSIATTTCGARENPPDAKPPEHLDYEMWTGPAPDAALQPLVHPRRWRAFMEYGNGIVGDMCIHMLDMVRWMLDLGWPRRISSSGGILVDRKSQANITDTQTGDLRLRRPARSSGRTAPGATPDPDYPWGATIYGDTRHAQGERARATTSPRRARASAIHRDVRHGAGQVSRGPRRARPGAPRRPRGPRPHAGLPASDRHARPAGRRHRGGPYLDARAASWRTCRSGWAAR